MINDTNNYITDEKQFVVKRMTLDIDTLDENLSLKKIIDE